MVYCIYKLVYAFSDIGGEICCCLDAGNRGDLVGKVGLRHFSWFLLICINRGLLFCVLFPCRIFVAVVLSYKIN